MFNRFFLEWKIQYPLFRWVVNLILAIIVFIAAMIGGSLGIKGIALEFSLIWPAAGISLAAVLLFGFRVLPGVFLGNFCYNFLQLYAPAPLILDDIIVAGFVSLGSTFQAFLGGYIIRRYTLDEYFNSLKDVLIFLIPAGLLTCVIASTIGNFAVFLYGGLFEKDILYTWVTFWLGDLTGVYIFTPLLVIWALEKPSKTQKKYVIEAILILIFFIIISYATFVLNYRFTHLYLPLCIWAAFRFSMHGATLMVFLTSVLTILLTSLGFGPFVPTPSVINPLLFLVSFLGVIVSTSLILAAVIKEREQSSIILEKSNYELQEEVHNKLEEIRDIYHEMFLKEKHASIGIKTFEITKHILFYLNKIRDLAKESFQPINTLEEGLKHEIKVLSSKLAPSFQKELKKIDRIMNLILQSEEHANRIAKMIQEHIAQSSKEKLGIKIVNLHTILNKRLKEALETMQQLDETFILSVEKKYDRNVTSITALPWELAYAFDQFINHALQSMRYKREQLGESYQPKLEINTRATSNGCNIVIKDNGKGVTEKELETLFTPFQEKELVTGERGFGLSLAYDIIVDIHHGEVQVDSKEGFYFHLTVKLPTHPYTT
ncbi:MAG: hypothetical protein K940chlam3_01178 [Chlamydiae bacterium]|nr:hypothetical protein [Chlamydiota bacterium]